MRGVGLTLIKKILFLIIFPSTGMKHLKLKKVTLNNFGCVCLRQKCMHNEPVVFSFRKERLQWFEFVILDPCDSVNQFYL